MFNHKATGPARCDWLSLGFVLMFALLFSGCGTSATPTAPPPTSPPATATLQPTPVLPTATLAPTLPPPTATLAPTLPPPTATLAPTLPPPTATLAPTLPPPTTTLAPTLPSATATSEPTQASAAATVDPAQPTLSIAMKATVAAENAIKASAECLMCHGPYEKLMAASVDFVTEDGESVNPHTTVDQSILKVHESGEGMLNCGTCHKPHPQPFTTLEDVPPANVEYCYLQCHHQDDFTPCSKCHSEYR